MRRKLPVLSTKEEIVMSVLWNVDKPLTALEVSKEDDRLNLSTVKQVLQKLLKKKYVEIAGIVHSGTSIARNYNFLISAEEYAADQLQAMRLTTFSFSTLNFVNHLIKQEESDAILKEMEEIIKSKKKEGK